MKSVKKEKMVKIILIGLFLALFLGVNVVYAATSAKISFCDYGGVRRTFKIIGILINLIKTIVPLLIIITAMVSFFKIVLSGKVDDFRSNLMQLVKNVIAGLIIFFIPAVIDFTIDSLVGYDDSGFAACSNCLLDTDHCVIPDVDPETYIED